MKTNTTDQCERELMGHPSNGVPKVLCVIHPHMLVRWHWDGSNINNVAFLLGIVAYIAAESEWIIVPPRTYF